MQLVKYLKFSAGNFDLMLFISGCLSRASHVAKGKSIVAYWIVFLHFIFFIYAWTCHTQKPIILLSSPSRGVPLSLNDPSLPKHIQLEAGQYTALPTRWHYR